MIMVKDAKLKMLSSEIGIVLSDHDDGNYTVTINYVGTILSCPRQEFNKIKIPITLPNGECDKTKIAEAVTEMERRWNQKQEDIKKRGEFLKMVEHDYNKKPVSLPAKVSFLNLLFGRAQSVSDPEPLQTVTKLQEPPMKESISESKPSVDRFTELDYTGDSK